MIGRAGRPQFDTSGMAIILTQHQNVASQTTNHSLEISFILVELLDNLLEHNSKELEIIYNFEMKYANERKSQKNEIWSKPLEMLSLKWICVVGKCYFRNEAGIFVDRVFDGHQATIGQPHRVLSSDLKQTDERKKNC